MGVADHGWKKLKWWDIYFDMISTIHGAQIMIIGWWDKADHLLRIYFQCLKALLQLLLECIVVGNLWVNSKQQSYNFSLVRDKIVYLDKHHVLVKPIDEFGFINWGILQVDNQLQTPDDVSNRKLILVCQILGSSVNQEILFELVLVRGNLSLFGLETDWQLSPSRHG